jgi:hypothetical protein
MKVMSAGFLLGVCLFLGYSSSSLFLTAQVQTAALALPHSSPTTADPTSRVYYIELSTLRDCLHGDCPSRFTDRNFAVSYQGRQYPVRVSLPFKANAADASGFPTHLLVVFPSGAQRPNDADLVKSLNRVFSEGWLVSINRPDGRFTQYSTGPDSLAAALAATPAAPLTDTQADLAAQSEIEILESYPSRRLLLLVVDIPRGKPVPLWRILAMKTHAQAYIVDGGMIKMVFYDESWGTGEAYTPGGGDYLPKKVRYSDNGVFHEVKFSAAMKDILKDARYDYNLQFTIPDSQSGPASPITLTLVKAQGLLPYQQNVELYTVAEKAANGNSIAARTIPPQKLLVEGWWK